MARNGLAQGANKGHVTEQRARKARPSQSKGVSFEKSVARRRVSMVLTTGCAGVLRLAGTGYSGPPTSPQAPSALICRIPGASALLSQEFGRCEGPVRSGEGADVHISAQIWMRDGLLIHLCCFPASHASSLLCNPQKLGKRTALCREIAREVAGLSPYERRILDMIKTGGSSADKRVYKFAKRRQRRVAANG